MITGAQLLQIMPSAASRIGFFLAPLNAAMHEFHINSPLRQAAFLAQIAHESGELRYVKELASGKSYEGRGDLGNKQPGDGARFKGRGLFQITGRANYERCGKYFETDLLSSPELLENAELACRSAGWFWSSKGLNLLADESDFARITRRINGGTNGDNQRNAYYAVALNILGVE